ncbi:ribonuclease H-like domain-containing protein [Tanacetum coccineum]
MDSYVAVIIRSRGTFATTEPASSSGQPSTPKTSIVVNARRNNEKALNILLSAIPDRHLLSFHDAQDARSLWAAIKARFGREELDSAYDRFQNIISMLELYDAKRTTGLDELAFAVLYNTEVALALMATSSTDSSNSEVPYCSNCSKSYKKLLNDYQTEKDNFQRARLEIQGYQLSLESLEVIIRTHEKNEYAWGDKYEQMEYDLKMRDWKLGEKQKEFDNVIKERDELKEKLEKWSNATLLQTEILNKQKVLSDKTCIGFGVEYSSSEESNNSSGDETLTGPLYENFKREKAYKAVPPPTGTIIPPRADVAFTGIDELAIRNKVINKQNSESSGTDHESCESKNRDDLIKNKEQTQNTVKSNTDRNKVIIEDWVDSDDEEVPPGVSEIKKQTVLKSETSSENKSPRSKDSFGQRSRRRGLGCRDGKGNPEEELKDHAIIDSGCSGSMTGDKDKLSDFKDYKGGYVAFGNDPKGGRITGKGTIKTSCIDFENVSYVKELKSFSIKFKIVDENLVLLRAPRKNDVYSLNLKSIIPSGGVTCLVAKASEYEAILWHRRLGHVNFKNINKLVKSNLVRGLPSKTFKHDHSCLACRKGKQHKASCKKLEERTVREPLKLARIPRSQKEFENLMLQETIAHTHMENQGIASEKRKEKGKEIYDLSESDDDLPKDGIFDGNSFDDENKEEEIDLDLNNMDNTIDVSSSSTLRVHNDHPQSQIIGPTASGVKQG